MDINKIQKVLERHIDRTLDSEFIKSLAMEIFVANDVVPDPAVLGSDKNFISDHDPGDEHVEKKFENEPKLLFFFWAGVPTNQLFAH